MDLEADGQAMGCGSRKASALAEVDEIAGALGHRAENLHRFV